jgi:hypothetical protein
MRRILKSGTGPRRTSQMVSEAHHGVLPGIGRNLTLIKALFTASVSIVQCNALARRVACLKPRPSDARLNSTAC